MTNPCPLCDKPIADTGYVCHACADHARDSLLRIAGDWADLETTRLRQDRIGDPGPASTEPPLPYNPRAAEVAWVIQNTLTTWAREIATTRGGEAPALVPDLARWLAEQAGWLRQRPEGEQALDELDSCSDLLRAAIDRPGPAVFCGRCDVCDRDLRARPGAATVECRRCDVTYDVTARREYLLELANDTLAHASLIARALDELGEPVKPERIRQWASRGRLHAKGKDAAGRPLYAVRDVRSLVSEDTRTGTGRRGRTTRRHAV